MAIEVVVGPPFSGKGRFVREAIERREAAGELGLIALDWTALYLALFPGAQSAFRDDAVADTGAPRLAGYTFEVIVAAIAARELAGYVLTQSPRRAVELAERVNGVVLEVEADVGDVADRADSHMRRLRRTVARAALDATLPRCRRAAVTYQRESSVLVGRARTVRGGRPGPVKQPFDRELWARGLTPRAREGLQELVERGDPTPSPADLQAWLLRDRR